MQEPLSPILTVKAISKSFPGVRALSAVDFQLNRGEIHSLMGENGAGKSTLIKVLTGVYQKDAGECFLDGKRIAPVTPKEAQDLGISTVYQEVNLIPSLTVAENIYVGRHPTKQGRIPWSVIKEGARAALARLDIHIDVTEQLGSFSIALQQMVAIARALDTSSQVLILDEPTSSLDPSEVEMLFRVMRKLRDEGMGIVFVSHFLDQVYAICDRITVLRNGQLVGAYNTAELPRMELVAKMMGKQLAALDTQKSQPSPEARTGASARPLVRAAGLGKKGSIEPLDLNIQAGEILGLAGLLGSGRTEVAKLLFGIDKKDQGEIIVDNVPVAIHSPRDALFQGFAFCPEDRKSSGIVEDLSVRENICLALQAKRGWTRPLSRKRQDELADYYIKALNIKVADAEQKIGTLSGGNQQKVIIARWLAAEPRFLILDEPTRGIDVGAKAEITKLIQSLADKGMAILLISAEWHELIRSCTRLVVMRDRKKIKELKGQQVNESEIMHAIAEGG